MHDGIRHWTEYSDRKGLYVNTYTILQWFDSGLFQALNLVRNLIIRGLYTDKSQLQSLLTPLMSLLDGRNDVPYTMRFSTHSSTWYF